MGPNIAAFLRQSGGNRSFSASLGFSLVRKALIFALLVTTPGICAEQTANRPSSIALRKRLHVNPLITEPDTLDFEWGGAFSTGGSFSFPTTLRFTPQGPHIYWGRTELSVSFDSLANDGTATHFGDRTTFAAT